MNFRYCLSKTFFIQCLAMSHNASPNGPEIQEPEASRCPEWMGPELWAAPALFLSLHCQIPAG